MPPFDGAVVWYICSSDYVATMSANDRIPGEFPPPRKGKYGQAAPNDDRVIPNFTDRSHYN
jgi:hypothetical protein